MESIMDSNQNILETMRTRSKTISSVLNVIREFSQIKKETSHDINHNDTNDATDLAENSTNFLEFPGTSLPRRSSSCPEGKDSLKFIKQRRDVYLRSMFKKNSTKAIDKEEEKEALNSSFLTSQGRGLEPSNDLQIDIDDTSNGDCTENNSSKETNSQSSEASSTMVVNKRVSFYQETLIHDAIQRDDLNELCELLNQYKNMNLNHPDIFGTTPLHRAATDGAYRCMNLLLSKNVNVNVRDIYGWTPLHDAVFHGNVRCAAALITAGSNVEAETNDFTRPIEMAHEDSMLLLVGRAMTSPGYIHDPDRETLV